MRQLVFGNQFLKSAEKLDKKLKSKLKLSLDVLLRNPFHPTLQTKPLTGKLSGYYSFRIGRDHRVIFQFVSEDKIYLLKIGNRRDIYR
jgi:toxin YoeB